MFVLLFTTEEVMHEFICLQKASKDPCKFPGERKPPPSSAGVGFQLHYKTTGTASLTEWVKYSESFPGFVMHFVFLNNYSR